MTKKIFFGLLFFGLVFTGCQDIIDISLPAGQSQLAVDAFLTNQSGAQQIVLTQTISYFANQPCPPINGATVKVTDNTNSKIYTFADSSNTGIYVWKPTAGDTLGIIGHHYTLSINYDGDNYSATSVINPVPPVDSITYKFGTNAFGKGNKYHTQFYATDIPHVVDFYWIKQFRNGVLDTKPADITVSQDGGFNGTADDGLLFIEPIRQIHFGTNLNIGDSVTVQIHAITYQTFMFLQEVRTQTTNGGLFATPPANVDSNIHKTTSNTLTTAVGWFSTAAVSTNSVTLH
ncbi:MAG TPA: DUF4249 domain-containing protein [Bacteroidia bacterium]|nr:DUF4249 domain-containing protein [Bacteroidia bacterium]